MSDPLASTSPATLRAEKDLPALPLALGATDHLSGNVVPLSLHWKVTPSSNGSFWLRLVLEEHETYKRACLARPSVQLVSPLVLKVSVRPATTATMVFSTLVAAATPDKHKKVGSVDKLMGYPGHVVVQNTIMAAPAPATLGFGPGINRNLRIEGVLGDGFSVQIAGYTTGVTHLDVSLEFSVELQGWLMPAPETLVDF